LAKTEGIELEGTIMNTERGHFIVETDEGHQILAHLGGKMRKHRIKVVIGDRVLVEVSPYDLTRGRIIFRER